MFEYKLLILIDMLGDVARRVFAEVNGGGHVRGKGRASLLQRTSDEICRGHNFTLASWHGLQPPI
jgi:hypothetical protein